MLAALPEVGAELSQKDRGPLRAKDREPQAQGTPEVSVSPPCPHVACVYVVTLLLPRTWAKMCAHLCMSMHVCAHMK